MSFSRVLVLSCAVLLTGAVFSPARAQSTSWGDLAVSAVAIDYDLSGVGRAPGFAVRLTRDLTPHVVLEARGLFAVVEEQYGNATLIIPDAQIQYRWNIARVSPFVGGGIGTAARFSDFHSDWDPALSVGGGAGIRLTDRMGLVGELRLRGIEWDFAASTAEWSLGLAWRLPAS